MYVCVGGLVSEVEGSSHTPAVKWLSRHLGQMSVLQSGVKSQVPFHFKPKFLKMSRLPTSPSTIALASGTSKWQALVHTVFLPFS